MRSSAVVVASYVSSNIVVPFFSFCYRFTIFTIIHVFAIYASILYRNLILTTTTSVCYDWGCFYARRPSTSSGLSQPLQGFRRGMEQRQLAWLITTRSQVRVLVPQPKYEPHRKMGFLFWFLEQTWFWGLARSQVRIACGCPQGNLLLKTCFQRRSFGVAKGDRVLPLLPLGRNSFAKVPGSVIKATHSNLFRAWLPDVHCPGPAIKHKHYDSM